MPATGQLMNDSLMEVEHTPPVHKRILDILPGVSGGVARIMVGQPFDTIKTRLQVLGKGTIGAAGMPPEMVYNSGMDCVKKMVSAMQGVVCGSQQQLGAHCAAARDIWQVQGGILSATYYAAWAVQLGQPVVCGAKPDIRVKCRVRTAATVTKL